MVGGGAVHLRAGQSCTGARFRWTFMRCWLRSGWVFSHDMEKSMLALFECSLSWLWIAGLVKLYPCLACSSSRHN